MKCFITNAVEQRLDCHYYQPEFVELENRISKLTDKKLGDYIISIAGGATPDKNEVDKYYSDSENGVPFLRVQNVTPEGLKLGNVVFINHETHNSMLKRSQVRGHYLITKITGVGRMAVSSVAPQDFTGNINQHLVAIKTESPEVSRVLAAFLNSDIGERLASRRSTGGTRPALDYEALKTIPIVFEPRIVDIMHSAYKLKEQKEAEAQKFLNSLDEYVLDELGIIFPETRNIKCYVVNSQNLAGNRIDASYHQPKFMSIQEAMKAGKYPLRELKEFITEIHYGASVKNEYVEDGIPFIRIVNVKPNVIELSDIVKLPYDIKKELGNAFVNSGDLLISRSGTIGVVAVVLKEADGYAFGSFMIKFRLNSLLDKEFASMWLNIGLSKLLTERSKIGTIQGNITIPAIKGFIIPYLPLDHQTRIANEVHSRLKKVDNLRKAALAELNTAKADTENLILGKKRVI